MRFVVALFLFAGVFHAATADAALILVDWTGSVTTSPAVSSIAFGTTITGTFVYDDATPLLYPVGGPTAANPYAEYNTAHESSFSVQGLSGTMQNNKIVIFDRPISADQFDSRATVTNPMFYTGDLIDGFSVRQIFVRFSDQSGAAFDYNTGLPLPSMLDRADFDSVMLGSRLDLADSNGNAAGSLNFRVTDFTFTPLTAAVPEPSSFAIFGLGALGLAGGALRRRTTNRSPLQPPVPHQPRMGRPQPGSHGVDGYPLVHAASGIVVQRHQPTAMVDDR